MGSEAAYFQDALARTGELCNAAVSSSEISSHASQAIHELGQVATPDKLSDISDEQLMEQVCSGAKEALSALFHRHARAVRNVAYRILRDEAEADDLLQEVFLFIFRKAALYDAACGRAATWIIHLAYTRAFDRRRYLNSRQFYSHHELTDGGLQVADPRQCAAIHEQTLEGIFGKPLMAKFNSRLTPEQRETIQLFFFEGYALKEIAELTGRSLVNVRSHYYRGLERLRKYVLPKKLRSK
jgi:RNA polymerase sigma-70 factor, ECF subfamily